MKTHRKSTRVSSIASLDTPRVSLASCGAYSRLSLSAILASELPSLRSRSILTSSESIGSTRRPDSLRHPSSLMIITHTIIATKGHRLSAEEPCQPSKIWHLLLFPSLINLLQMLIIIKQTKEQVGTIKSKARLLTIISLSNFKKKWPCKRQWILIYRWPRVSSIRTSWRITTLWSTGKRWILWAISGSITLIRFLRTFDEWFVKS